MQAVQRFLLILWLALCASAATSPKAAHHSPVKSAKPPNIILLTLDTTRADRMGFLGSTRGLTPNLDALAEHSVVFTRAYAQVPLTTPSHAALLTGTYPQYNQLRDLGGPLRKDLPYLPDLLKRHGYHTAAFIGANILDPKSGTAPGFDRGFDLYDADFHDPRPGEDRYHGNERRAGTVADHALRWLTHHPQGPFFIWLHFFDPHDPYDPPSPFKERYASAPYDGEIAYMDSAIGTFMETLHKLGLDQNSVIAVAADHGEAFGEHGEERHGMFLYDETVHVPLLFKLPAAKVGGKRVDSRVGLVDLAPSLLAAAGVVVPPSVQGHSLLPLMENGPPIAPDKPVPDKKEAIPERTIYSESNYAHHSFGWSELRSWRSGDYLYVQAPRRELYNVSTDPPAAKNLASSAKAVADTLDAQLSTFRQKTSSAETGSTSLDPAQVAKLRALGYLAADAGNSKNTANSAIDPKDKIEVANRYHRALQDIEENHPEQAIENLRDLAAHDPGTFAVYLELGHALDQMGRYQEALPFLHTAAEKAPDSMMTHYELSQAFVGLDQLEEALKEMQAAVVCQPGSASLHYNVGSLQVRLRQLPQADKEFQKSLELDPNYFDANFVYGRLLLMKGDADAALPKLLRAVKLKPDSADAHKFLADAYTELGKTAMAAREQAASERLGGSGQQ